MLSRRERSLPSPRTLPQRERALPSPRTLPQRERALPSPRTLGRLPGRGGLPGKRSGANGLDCLDIIRDTVFVPILRRGLRLRRDGELAEIGIVGAGHDDSLSRGGKQRLDQGAFVGRIFEHPAVQLQRAQTIFLVHEGQQLAELGQKSLLINKKSPPNCISQFRAIADIISANAQKVKKNASKAGERANCAVFSPFPFSPGENKMLWRSISLLPRRVRIWYACVGRSLFFIF